MAQLTSNKIPKATEGYRIEDSLLTDDGTTLTYSGTTVSLPAVTFTGDFTLAGDLNHDGSNVGFFAVTPAARPGATDDIKDALTSLGLLQGTSATPLDLDGGALTAGAGTFSSLDVTGDVELTNNNFFKVQDSGGDDVSVIGVNDQDDTVIDCDANGFIDFRIDGTQKARFQVSSIVMEIETFCDDGLVVNNPGSADADFRAETDTLNHAFFVKASDDTVHIGYNSAPTGTAALNVNGEVFIAGDIDHDGSNVGFFAVTPAARPGATDDIKDALTSLGLLQGTSATPLDLDGGTLTAGIGVFSGSGLVDCSITTTGGGTYRAGLNLISPSVDFSFAVNTNDNFRIRDNTAGASIFTIEAGASADSIYIDASGNIGIGTSSPGSALDVNMPTILRGVGEFRDTITIEKTSDTGAAALRLGSSTTEGLEIKVFGVIKALSGVSTDLSFDLPNNAIVLGGQINIETAVTAGGTSTAVGLGPTSDPDKYGETANLTQNQKAGLLTNELLSSLEDIKINMTDGAGSLGDTGASAGSVRVKIYYLELNPLDDA